MLNTIENLTVTEINNRLIATKRELKKLIKEISSIDHLIDKNGVEAIHRNNDVITLYRKSTRIYN